MRQYRLLALCVLCAFLGGTLTFGASPRVALSQGPGTPPPPPTAGGPGTFLTGPSSGAPLDIALAYLRSNPARLRLHPDDLNDLAPTDLYATKHNGVTHVYLQQQLNGIPVHNAIVNVNVMGDGRILSVGNRAVANLKEVASTDKPAITPVEAVELAAKALGLDAPTAPLTRLSSQKDAKEAGVLSAGGISREPIPVQLVYQPLDNGTLRLAWDLAIYQVDADHYWSVRIDAQTGELLDRHDLVIHDDWGAHTAAPQGAHGDEGTTAIAPPIPFAAASSPAASPMTPDAYRVYALPIESPNHGARTLVSNPADTLASPYGWHDTNGAPGAEYTITRGNNAHAYQDPNELNASSGDEPNGGGTLTFDFPLDLTLAPTGYIPAATVNLFYWNNLTHDLNYHYGFDEASGNFQTNNYGRGGLGNDAVRAEAQDKRAIGHRNNANFLTLPDGQAPRMQMFLWNTTTPERDGDLDAGIILHEYGHGISTRLTGGPSTVSCLNNEEQMGEGWSDWQSLVFTALDSHTATTARGVGTYALGQPVTGPGIRAFPYTTDMAIDPRTYDAIKSASVPHGVGSVWTAMLWEVYWKLVTVYGFDSDLTTGTGGNNLAIQLVNDGMKLQPCSPGFVDGRDAILAADVAATGGANQCLIWEAFAKRGLGYSATQGSSASRADGTEAFDLPPQCQTPDFLIGSFDPNQSICNTVDTVTYPLIVNQVLGFNNPISLALQGRPAGTMLSFNQNPVTPPSQPWLTIDYLTGVPAGTYSMVLTGTSGSKVHTTTLSLSLNAPLVAPTLTSPANGAVVATSVSALTWAAVSGATSYDIQLASDPSFNTIVASATGLTSPSFAVPLSLSENTAYFWRVRANNMCLGAYSAPSSFVLSDIETVHLCRAPNVAIPDNQAEGINDVLAIPNSFTIADLNVVVTATHSWVGDLTVTLTRNGGTPTSVTVIDRPGVPQSTFGCGNNHIRGTLDDEATAPVENACLPSAEPAPPPYAIDGTFTPQNPLSAFDGQSITGNWTINVSDVSGDDSGTLQSWCVVALAPPPSADYSDSPATYHLAWHYGTGAIRLGTNWSNDTSTLPNVDNDSDDGVEMVSASWSPGSPVSLNVTASGSGWLSGWFDWNSDGDFDSNERAINQAVVAGINPISFNIPADSTVDSESDNFVYSRFRLYDSPTEPLGLAPTATIANGTATGGEVEDYAWAFTPNLVTLRGFQATLPTAQPWSPALLLALGSILSLAALVMVRRR